MGLFDIFAVLITLSALLAYLNFRFLKLPTVIGLIGNDSGATAALLVSARRRDVRATKHRLDTWNQEFELSGEDYRRREKSGQR